jgi:hypothetical protein
MKFNRIEAKALTNAKELELYDTARAPRLNKLSVKELKNVVKRSRTLRDKLQDKKRGQVRSNQASTRSRGVEAADRSKEKAELFSEVHDIFVARLEKVEAAETKSKEKEKAAKSAASKKPLASAAGGRGAGAAARSSSRSAKASTASKAAVNTETETIQKPQEAARKNDPVGKVEQDRIARSGITKQRGHLSSVTKRRQGKRDAK